LPVIAPLLYHANPASMYSNFHAAVEVNGYFANTEFYNSILYQHIKGFIRVPVIHCTYFIRNEWLNQINYTDESYRHEYVIFSDVLRRAEIPQYIDNTEIYGRITFSTNEAELIADYQHTDFRNLDEYIKKSFPHNAI
jgi:hypothetical protein